MKSYEENKILREKNYYIHTLKFWAKMQCVVVEVLWNCPAHCGKAINTMTAGIHAD